MRYQAKLIRRTTTDDEAREIACRIKAMDYELMAIVTGPSPLWPAPLTLKAQDLLGKIQRQLRTLRIEMEVERGFDTPPMPRRVLPPIGPHGGHSHPVKSKQGIKIPP
ncbi:hypothetical protein [Paracoccus aminovorans]|uniref:hypothetical protein n=1 Tax=Paracoccus aminovorans TaxID=34004 RepID=UPI002B25BAC8|nr:hypothetical protein [Paracoccus aminovorans]